MRKKFVTNLALLLILNLLIKPFWILGIDRSVQNIVGAESYGIYYALLNFSFLLNILLDLGITNFNNKNIAQNNHLLNKHMSSIISLKIVLAIAYIIIIIFLGYVIGYREEQIYMLLFVAFNQVLIFFILYLRSNLAGLHLFKTDSFISVLDRSIMIIICATLLWGHIIDKPFNIKMYIYVQTFSYLITALITLLIVIKKAQLKRLKWNLPFSLFILKKSYPYAILFLLMVFYNRIDTVMLERMLVNGAQQSGIYASAYRILDAANMIAFLFSGLLLPIFARMIKLKESVEELARLAFSILIIPAIIIAVSSFFYGYELMDLMYTEHVKESASIFGYLMSCFVAISTTYIFGTLLTANGNLKQLNLVAGISISINFLLNLILIPRFQAQGSAISSLVTQYLTALAQLFITYQVFRLHINYKFILSIIIFVFGVILIHYLAQYLSPNWILNIIIALLLSIILAFSIRILNIRSLFRIIRYE